MGWLANLLAVVALGVVPIAGCGDESGFGDAETEMLARAAVECTSELAVLPSAPTQAGAIVNAARVLGKLSQVGDAKRAYEMERARAVKNEEEAAFVDPNCISQSDDTITYTDCELTTGSLVEGTVSSSGDTLTLNLRVALFPATQEEFTLTTHIRRTITITNTALNGTLRYEDVYGDGTQIDRVYADYAVTLDGAGCPVGGQLAFEQQCEGCHLVNVVATYGPSCGNVTLE